MTWLNGRLAAALPAIEVDVTTNTAAVGRRQVAPAEPAFLRHELAHAIYDELHAGRTAPDVQPGRSLRDRGVEEQLADLLPHPELTRDLVPLAVRPDKVLVVLDGVRVWVPRRMVRAPDGVPRAGTPAAVRVPAARPALSPGFFYAEGGAAWRPAEPVFRVYVHLRTMPAAYAAWGRVLPMLADLGIGYRAKVVSSPDLLPRRDALVLYVAGRDRDPVPGGVAALTEAVRGIGAEVSAFARPVAPGVAVAWDPADPRPAMRGLSFGEHRAAALADGLIRHAARRSDGDQSPLGATVRTALIEARIDPDEPSRNLPPSGPAWGGASVVS